MSKPHYSIHEDLGYVTISKWISYEKGWKNIASMSMDELIERLGLTNK